MTGTPFDSPPEITYDISLPSVRGSDRHLLDPLRDLPRSSTVLDLGCGTGDLTLALAAQRPELQVVGIDHSSEYVGHAEGQRQVPGAAPEVEDGRRSLLGIVAPEAMVDFSALDAAAADGVRTGILREAGFAEASSTTIRWTYACPDFETWWTLIRHPIFPLGTLFAALDDADTARARGAMLDLVAAYRRADGGYAIPFACQLLTGRR